MADRPGGTICLEELRRRIARLEAPRQPAQDQRLPSGCEALDRLLPAGGFRRGTLVEWLSAGDGAGAGTLALLAAREVYSAEMSSAHSVCGKDRKAELKMAVCWPCSIPAASFAPRPPSGWESPWSNCWWFSPKTSPTMIGRSTRCCARRPSGRCWPGRKRLTPGPFAAGNWRPKRAAGWGCCCGRPPHAPIPPGPTCGCWSRPLPKCATACLQAVHPPSRKAHCLQASSGTPLPQRPPLRITLLRCRGGTAGRSVEVELDDETHLVHPEQRRLQIAN